METNIDPGLYTDFSELQKLRHNAAQDEEGTLRQVAQQFEALFIQMSLKSVRDASTNLGGDSLVQSDALDTYQEMYDKQIAVTVASAPNGTGLADVLVKQLGKYVNKGNASTEQQSTSKGFAADNSYSTHNVTYHNLFEDVEQLTRSLKNPADFVKSLWPYAVRAAEALNTDPKVLVAQAALETNWGRSMIEKEGQQNSFNLFGIKADGRWQKDRAISTTHEYEDGRAYKIQDAFRSYDGYADSFNDYVNFIKGNGRYKKAMSVAEDPHAYARALQDSGYATDPHYARKIINIMNSKVLNDSLDAMGSDL